jgi:CRP-like cAMP-binding protein
VVWKGSVSVSGRGFSISSAEGSCFGELSLLSRHPLRRKATVTAKTFLTVAVLTKTQFLLLTDTFPADMQAILPSVAALVAQRCRTCSSALPHL